ncbi:UNVERIFIED_CONTAM: hypothetical protein PYX00_008758 [Menopon gallinae]|uniref:Urea transporter n=1 Tax=Menopon gallinae TaxID=328185 RepID=A0AAW2HPJ7_9NEOP
MSESDTLSKPSKFFGKDAREKFLVFAGDCELINEYLHLKSQGSVFVLLRYINSLLRSFGYVIFANNPISGFIIMVSILSADPTAGLAAVLCSTLSFLFALILKQDSLGNLNGFFGYNAVLLGTCTAGLLPRLYDSVSVDEPKFWLFLIFTTFVSVYVTSALANLFRYLGQHPIPCFLLPFNFLQYILIFCLLNNSVPPTVLSEHLLRAPGRADLVPSASPPSERYPPNAERTGEGLLPSRDELSRSADLANGTPSVVSELPLDEDRIPGNVSADTSANGQIVWNWGRVFSGTIVSASRVYGLDHVPASAFILLALMFYSPITTLFCYTGSVIATLLGTAFAARPEEVYDGLWGYNGFLCGGALAGFGFVLTVHSALLTFGAVLFSTVLQHCLTPMFSALDVPMFAVPFNLTAILFLFVTSDSEKALSRPANYTFPEKHRYEFNRRFRREFEGYPRRARVAETSTSKSDV